MKILKIIIAILILFPGFAFCQTVDFSVVENNQRVIIVTIVWTADGIGAATENFNIDVPELPNLLAGRHCYQAETYPGPTTPTDGYDIDISTEDGLSVFKTGLNNRSDTTPEDSFPWIGDPVGTFGFGVKTVAFDSSGNGDVWNFAVSNAGALGQGILKLFFR